MRAIDPRICAEPGCGQALSRHNRSGLCRQHAAASRNLGKKHSPETVEKMRAAKLGKKHSPETVEKMRAAKRLELARLTPAERTDYDLIKRKMGYSRNEALAAIGRHDLIQIKVAAE